LGFGGKPLYRAGNDQPSDVDDMAMDHRMRGMVIGWQLDEGCAWVIKAWVGGGWQIFNPRRIGII